MVYSAHSFTAPAVALGTLAFAFQIYCDFSGYSDIARGTARLLGFDIMRNFDLPYFSTSLREFWRRWHISLSTWLRDYLYISLGGSRRGPARTYLNLLLTMLLGGLWHGAAWNFILWGLWHGAGLAAERAWNGERPQRLAGETGAGLGSNESRPRRVAGWIVTFSFVLYGWLLFRAGSAAQILSMTRALGDFSFPDWTGSFLLNLGAFVAPMILVEVWQFVKADPLVPLRLRAGAKTALQGMILTCIVLFWEKKEVAFIYFQF
jgi:D-alanyl-lipoteichoic acid acyltransferase DltB (MBOAT superfamily)